VCGLAISSWSPGGSSTAPRPRPRWRRPTWPRRSPGARLTTRVNYPQAVAFFAARGVRFDPFPRLPGRLTKPPSYPMAIAAGALRLLPARGRARRSLPSGAGAAVRIRGRLFPPGAHLSFSGLAVGLAFDLGRACSGPPRAGCGESRLFVSVPVWPAGGAVNGTALMMVLGLAAFQPGGGRVGARPPAPRRPALGSWAPCAAPCSSPSIRPGATRRRRAFWGTARRFGAGARWRRWSPSLVGSRWSPSHGVAAQHGGHGAAVRPRDQHRDKLRDRVQASVMAARKIHSSLAGFPAPCLGQALKTKVLTSIQET